MYLNTLFSFCTCPLGAEIDDITVPTCPENFGQVQKVIFQRTKDGSTINEITIATTDPALLATWTGLKSASDSTKATVSPYIQSPETEPGTVREFGGGNATVGGIPITLGANPTSFTGLIYRMRQDVIETLKTYSCDEISIFLANENGQIGCLVDDIGTPTKVKGIPIQAGSLFIGDKKLGGFEEPDSNAISWKWAANWSDKFYVVSPTDFAANTDL